jgi:hypothetical protein
MAGFSLAAAASIAAGLSLGAAATVGMTLVVQDGKTAPGQGVPSAPMSTIVQYGDRCQHQRCPPCNSTAACLNSGLTADDRSRKP